jgi:hypothetical protein
MGRLGLSLVAGLVGWHIGAQAPAAGPAITVSAATSALAQADKAADEPAKNKPRIADPGSKRQPTAEPTKDTPSPAMAGPQTTAEDICRTVQQAAAENQLPVNFFARVIWQESRFNARAVGRKGAEGIAQFMPKTADSRGLADPFDPISSLANAARYLGDLRKRLGNLGLAAAGYNAGPGRVREWLDGRRALPSQTRNYVAVTTGWTADEWASPSPPSAADTAIPQDLPCASIARLVLVPLTQAGRIAACVPPRGLQLTASWSKARAWATYRTPQEHLATLSGDRQPIMLRKRLGNLGLAAACSNADPGWVHEWRAAKGALIAAGWTADESASPSLLKAAQTAMPQDVSFAATARLGLPPPNEARHTVAHVPRWGAQLTANWSETGAWATYRALQRRFAALIGDREPIMLSGQFPGLGAAPRYMIRIADDSRAYLEGLCSKLIAAGGACAVLRNQQDQGERPKDSQFQ